MAFDTLPEACEWIANQYGKEAEVWINGDDWCMEGAAVYLDNLRDWRTGERFRRISLNADEQRNNLPFAAYRRALFQREVERESFLALGSMSAWSGLGEEGMRAPGVERLMTANRAAGPGAVGLVFMRVSRWGTEWMPFAGKKYEEGDRGAAVVAWNRAVMEDGEAWAAMNNLAWVALEEGRTEEARDWIDQAMEHEEARENASVRDTAAAVRRAEERRGKSEKRTKSGVKGNGEVVGRHAGQRELDWEKKK